MADDPLEESLRVALGAAVPARRGPPEDRIAALRAAAAARRDLVDAASDGRAAHGPRRVGAEDRAGGDGLVPSPAPAHTSHPWARRALVAAVVLVAFAAGALVAARPPAAVRDAARAAGFDVASSDLVAARARLDELGGALAVATERRVAGSLTDAELDAVARTDRDMLAAIGRLDDDERAALVPTAHQVHLRAVALFLDEGRTLPTAQPRDLEEVGAGS